ncbi:MAG TPA: VOC family protein [Mycobacteriales bacterium]|nr:VOC family protein [Mycobacteriales bacterium]
MDSPLFSLGAPMHVTVDCLDPQRLARFWSGLTGQRVAHEEGPFVFLAGPSREATAMAFQQVSEPTRGKNRVHVDFRTADLDGACAMVERLGGTLLDDHAEMGARWQVAADPEGNVFCLVEAKSTARS